MLHVASVCTPYCMLLVVVVQSLKPVRLLAACKRTQQLPTLFKTNRFHLAVGLFSNRLQKTSKWGKKYHWHIRGSSSTFFVFATFWRHLRSITEQMHGHMESIKLLSRNDHRRPQHGQHLSSYRANVKVAPVGVISKYYHTGSALVKKFKSWRDVSVRPRQSKSQSAQRLLKACSDRLDVFRALRLDVHLCEQITQHSTMLKPNAPCVCVIKWQGLDWSVNSN